MNKKGFTLIELLVVMSVIAILAGIVLVSLRGFREKGQDSKRIAEIRQIQNVLEIYYTANGQYPETLIDLQAASGQTGVIKLPKDPGSGQPEDHYLYGVDNDFQSYVLGAKLDAASTVLKDDLDGTVFNVYCGTVGDEDAIYCVSF